MFRPIITFLKSITQSGEKSIAANWKKHKQLTLFEVIKINCFHASLGIFCIFLFQKNFCSNPLCANYPFSPPSSNSFTVLRRTFVQQRNAFFTSFLFSNLWRNNFHFQIWCSNDLLSFQTQCGTSSVMKHKLTVN